jgi:uncharacterized protein (TIGR02597 family)
MKPLRSSLAIILAAGLSANAQTTATTDPVGFVSYTVNANSDQRLGLPMQQASTFQGTAATVSDTIVSASGITSLSGANFLVVTSGTANGKWEQIQSSAAGSVTLVSSISGFANGDSFEIKPFWTLGTLLPNGGGVPASTDVFSPVGYVFLLNPNAVGVNIPANESYIYHDGSERTAGWYDANDPDSGLKNSVVVSPEVSLIVRNETGASAKLTYVGSVPTDKFALDIVSRATGEQDNVVYNKFPADVTLGASGLAPVAVNPSPDVFSPTDVVYLFALNATGQNGSASAAYIYHDGSERTEGWYDNNDPDSGLKNNVVLPAGSTVMIRKAASANATVSWNPATPYTP